MILSLYCPILLKYFSWTSIAYSKKEDTPVFAT